MDSQTIEISARLSSIVKSSRDAIISKKFDGTITSWNKAAQKIFGYTAEEAIDKNISIIVPEDLYEEEEEIISKVKKGELIEHYETLRITKEGNKIPVALTISPIKDNDGNIIGISKIARDISEQKEAEEKQATLASIVNSSDDAIISKTLDGIITSWNKAAHKMFGYTEAEAIGKHISIIIPPDRLNEEKMIMEHIRKGLRVDHFETLRVGKNGKEVNISLTVSPLLGKDGRIIGASKIARDISDQKVAEEKQATLASIVNSSDDAIISKTLDGIITSWNKAAHKMFGYTEAEAIGKHISIIIPQDRLNEEKMIIENIRKRVRVDHFETLRVGKDGKEVNISLTVSPLLGKDGRIIGASKIARDISDQKVAEEKQATLASIVNSSDDAIISKTLDGIITSWNKSAHKMFGYTEAEAIGKHISIIIPPDRLNEETMIIENIRKGIKTDHFETIRYTKDGKEINISLTVSPIVDRDGRIMGASKIARDITQNLEAEKQRQLYTEKLQELNNYKDEFMSMASHELKTPLTIIKANLEILLLKMREDDNSSFVHNTLKQINKLGKLIKDLLDNTKIQSGQLQLNIDYFDMKILLKETINNIQPTTSIQIISNANNDKVLAHGDMERIGLVLVNLLSNAIKYSPGSREIFADTYTEDDKIIVRITDNGIGIPPEDITNIFSRFYRVGHIRSTFSGSGIGLYIASEIISRHKGMIWAESEINKGSVFYFSIPASG